VQADAARLQADEKDVASAVLLEALDARLAVAGRAVEALEGDVSLGELLADEIEQRSELRKDERLLPLLHDRLQVLEEGVELGALVPRGAAIDEAGVAGHLPQAEQRLEHVDGVLRHALLADAREERRPVVLPQVVVDRALLPAEH